MPASPAHRVDTQMTLSLSAPSLSCSPSCPFPRCSLLSSLSPFLLFFRPLPRHPPARTAVPPSSPLSPPSPLFPLSLSSLPSLLLSLLPSALLSPFSSLFSLSLLPFFFSFFFSSLLFSLSSFSSLFPFFFLFPLPSLCARAVPVARVLSFPLRSRSVVRRSGCRPFFVVVSSWSRVFPLLPVLSVRLAAPRSQPPLPLRLSARRHRRASLRFGCVVSAPLLPASPAQPGALSRPCSGSSRGLLRSHSTASNAGARSAVPLPAGRAAHVWLRQPIAPTSAPPACRFALGRQRVLARPAGRPPPSPATPSGHGSARARSRARPPLSTAKTPPLSPLPPPSSLMIVDRYCRYSNSNDPR